MLFPFEYVYLIHLKTVAQHFTGEFLSKCLTKMPDVTIPFKCTHWYQHRKGGHTKIIINRQGFLNIISPKEIPPCSRDATVPILSERGHLVCTTLIMDCSLRGPPMPTPGVLRSFSCMLVLQQSHTKILRLILREILVTYKVLNKYCE